MDTQDEVGEPETIREEKEEDFGTLEESLISFQLRGQCQNDHVVGVGVKPRMASPPSQGVTIERAPKTKTNRK